MKDNSTSNTYKFLFISLMLLVVAASVAIFLNYNRYETAMEEHIQNALRVEEIDATPMNILGDYSVQILEAGVETQYTASIREDSLGNPVMTLYDEYEPRKLMLTLNEDGSLYSDYLGRGIMSFKSNIGKIIIRFEKEDMVCTLTR